MTTEEKAKAYDEALKRIENLENTTSEEEAVINYIFLQLHESEDERIRKAISTYLYNELNNIQQLTPRTNEFEKWLAWLEKQKEQLAEEDSSEKDLAECYLSKFDKKFPILPTLKGKRLADYKNFLNTCQQVFGLKEWGIHPTQAKLFAKLTLLWASWGAEHLQWIGAIDGDNEMDEEITLAYKIVPKFNIGDTIVNKKNGKKCTIADRCLLYQYYSDINHRHEIKFDEQDDWELVEQKEQKPAEWSEEDIAMLDCVTSILCQDDKYEENKRQVEWLKKIKDKAFPQLRQEWSGEDNAHIESIISTIEYCKRECKNSPICVDSYNADLDWLKSLRPVKQEWSEEDEKMRCNILNALTPNLVYSFGKGTSTGTSTYKYDKEIAWLKSLPLRCPKSSDNWKPGEEQIKALEECGEYKRRIKELYDDLVKNFFKTELFKL